MYIHTHNAHDGQPGFGVDKPVDPRDGVEHLHGPAVGILPQAAPLPPAQQGVVIKQTHTMLSTRPPKFLEHTTTTTPQIMYLTALIAFSSASDTVGLVLCAAVLVRLRDQSREPGVFEVCRRILKHRRVSSLVLLAASSTFVRLVRACDVYRIVRVLRGIAACVQYSRRIEPPDTQPPPITTTLDRSTSPPTTSSRSAASSASPPSSGSAPSGARAWRGLSNSTPPCP